MQKRNYEEKCQKENEEEILTCDMVDEETKSKRDDSVSRIIDPKLPKIQRRKELMRYRYNRERHDRKEKQVGNLYSGCEEM